MVDISMLETSPKVSLAAKAMAYVALHANILDKRRLQYAVLVLREEVKRFSEKDMEYWLMTDVLSEAEERIGEWDEQLTAASKIPSAVHALILAISGDSPLAVRNHALMALPDAIKEMKASRPNLGLPEAELMFNDVDRKIAEELCKAISDDEHALLRAGACLVFVEIGNTESTQCLYVMLQNDDDKNVRNQAFNALREIVKPADALLEMVLPLLESDDKVLRTVIYSGLDMVLRIAGFQSKKVPLIALIKRQRTFDAEEKNDLLRKHLRKFDS